MTNSIRNILTTAANIFMAIVAFFIGLRLVLKVSSANPQTPFVSWINQVSDMLMAPFKGIFPQASVAGTGTIDFSAFVAIIAYAILVYLFVALVNTIANAAITRGHEHGHIH